MRVITRCLSLLCAAAVLFATDDVGTAAAATTTTLAPRPVVVSDSSVALSGSNSFASQPSAASPSPVPIHSAQVNSDTFRVTDNVVCPDIVASRINAVYTKNKKMFTTCMEKSGYQIFPYSGKVPTATDITLMVQTPQCMGVITAVALSDFPACSIGDMPVKAVVETLLKISVDMADGAKAPSAKDFHALMAWRRDVNAAQSVGVPYDSDSELYALFKKALWRVMSTTTVKVLSDLTIVYAGSISAGSISAGSGASENSIVGTVKPSNATGSASVSSSASTSSVVAQSPSPAQSSAMRPAASTLLLVGASTLGALVAWMV